MKSYSIVQVRCGDPHDRIGPFDGIHKPIVSLLTDTAGHPNGSRNKKIGPYGPELIWHCKKRQQGL